MCEGRVRVVRVTPFADVSSLYHLHSGYSPYNECGDVPLSLYIYKYICVRTSRRSVLFATSTPGIGRPVRVARTPMIHFAHDLKESRELTSYTTTIIDVFAH